MTKTLNYIAVFQYEKKWLIQLTIKHEIWRHKTLKLSTQTVLNELEQQFKFTKAKGITQYIYTCIGKEGYAQWMVGQCE